MNPTTKKLLSLVQKWLEKKSAAVNRNEVIKDIYLEVEITAGYFLVLTIANLIALSGLITNSSPVIIGSMLISPLMGPILNIGFAFITGDKFVWVKSTKKISLSVGLTLIVAAIATYLSPLKDITNEIISGLKKLYRTVSTIEAAGLSSDFQTRQNSLNGIGNVTSH